MPKYVLVDLVLKTCACMIYFALLPNLKMRYNKTGEVIRQGLILIILSYSSSHLVVEFADPIRKQIFLFPQERYCVI